MHIWHVWHMNNLLTNISLCVVYVMRLLHQKTKHDTWYNYSYSTGYFRKCVL